MLPKVMEVRPHPAQELINRLRKVTMLEGEKVEVYRSATISLEHLATDHLAPPQRYVLLDRLILMRELRWALAEHGFDLYALDGFVELILEDAPQPIAVLPPIVEESIEANGRVVPLICDGLHRIFLARLEWMIPQVVYVRGVDKRFPYYAFPNPNGWADVQIVNESAGSDAPAFVKKWHRIRANKSLYRDFNAVFGNLSVPRGPLTT